MIRLTGVSCLYDRNEALRCIDLTIGSGEAVAVIGPNGSGKSTLLKLLAGVVTPSAGTYFFDGHPVSADALHNRRFSKLFHQRVGLLFQNPDAQLFCPDVQTEIAFGPRQMGLSEETVGERVEDCLGLLGIAHLRERPHYHLSEGEKRKVALAAVLSLNPDVLLLDEPMSGLDPRTKRSLDELLRTLHDVGKTVVCSTHDFDRVDGAAGNGTSDGFFQRAIVFSEQHALVRTGTFSEVVDDTEFLRMHNII